MSFIIWGDQPGLKSEMEKLQSFQNKFAKKIKLGKMSSSEALKSLNWLPLAGRRLSHRCTAVQNAIKGDIPQHFESFTLRLLKPGPPRQCKPITGQN